MKDPSRFPAEHPSAMSTSVHPTLAAGRPPEVELGLGTILFGVLCQVAVILWIIRSEVPGKVFISSWSVVLPGILLLTFLIALRPVFPKALTRTRLLVAYAMLSASCCLVGYGAIQAMFAAITGQFYSPRAATKYAAFSRYTPEWLVPRDPKVLKGLYVGNASVPWHAWLPPLLAWGALLSAFAFAMIALAVLLARVWIRYERLTFPIVQLPLEMTAERTPFFRSRLMWLGFCVPAVLESLLALNYYYPSVPAIQLKHVNFFTPNTPFPWNAADPLLIGFTPFVIGFAFLAPTDISFSIFFFGVADRLLHVWAAWIGAGQASAGVVRSEMPFSTEQSVGAFLAFAILPLWRAWPHIRARLRDPEARAERGALIALALSGVFLIAFLSALGLPPLLSGLIVLLVLLFATALARIRTESGTAWAFGPYRGVSGNLTSLAGTSPFSVPTLASLGTIDWIFTDLRFLPMPFHLESLKIGDAIRVKKSAMAFALGVATVVGIALGFYGVLTLEYKLGLNGGKMYGGITFWSSYAPNRVANWTANRTGPDTTGLPWVGIGALVTILLAYLRQRFLWWPLHPIGYVLGHTGTGLSFWTHYGIAWALKSLVLRYGGNDLYRRVLPFVFGVIFGDIFTQTAWSVGAVLIGAPVYQFVS